MPRMGACQCLIFLIEMHVCPVWRYSSPPTCRPVLGDHWEVQSDQVLHSSDSHPPADEVRTGTAAEVRACISSECRSSSNEAWFLNHIFQKPQQEFDFQNTAWPDRWSECVFIAGFASFHMKISIFNFEKPPSHFLYKSSSVVRWRNQTVWIMMWVWTCFFFSCIYNTGFTQICQISISVKKMWGKIKMKIKSFSLSVLTNVRIIWPSSQWPLTLESARNNTTWIKTMKI